MMGVEALRRCDRPHPSRKRRRRRRRGCVLDYAEGWYQGSAERTSRALHPELVKRIVVRESTTGRRVLSTMGASALANAAGRGYGTKTPGAKQEKEVRILDGRRVIVNVRWERKPGRGA